MFLKIVKTLGHRRVCISHPKEKLALSLCAMCKSVLKSVLGRGFMMSFGGGFLSCMVTFSGLPSSFRQPGGWGPSQGGDAMAGVSEGCLRFARASRAPGIFKTEMQFSEVCLLYARAARAPQIFSSCTPLGEFLSLHGWSGAPISAWCFGSKGPASFSRPIPRAFQLPSGLWPYFTRPKCLTQAAHEKEVEASLSHHNVVCLIFALCS